MAKETRDTPASEKQDRRIHYLEKLARSNLFGLDLLASLGELHHDASLAGDPDKILALSLGHLKRLARFDRMAFYRVDEGNSEFLLAQVDPADARDRIRREVDAQVESGNFAWAVRQNRPVVVATGSKGKTMVLHVLATRSRVRGMFAGVLAGDQAVNESLLYPLSIILQSTANALEAAALHGLLTRRNEDLEAMVSERTRDLEKQTEKLKAEILNRTEAEDALKEKTRDLEERAEALKAEILNRTQAEDALKEKTRDLEEQTETLKEEIASRRLAEESLMVAREEAVAGARLKSDFIANVSHEFRTPLNAILGYGEILKFEAEKMNRPDLVEDLKSIETAGRHLLGLINDILDFSKIQAGKVELHSEPFSVEDLVEDVMTTIRPLARRNDNHVRVDCGEPAGVMTSDPTRVRQILLNLLSNANKFTEDGEVVLEVRRRKIGEADWVQFTVRDTGIGIDAEKILTLFQEFIQGEVTTTRKYGGTGLGLAISHRLCQMLGGDISVSSQRGKGSVFTVNLPVNAPLAGFAGEAAPPIAAAECASPPEAQAVEEAQEPPVSEPVSGGGEARDLLLVIDDDQIVRDLVRRFSEREGYRVVTAASGEEGLRRVVELQPAVITLDVMMPGMDGWTVLEKLKADPALKNIPVVMLTILEERERALALGAAEHLVKPIDWSVFFEVLKKHRTAFPTTPVLVVEDDIANRKALCRLLRREGWHVLEAIHGHSAFKIMEREAPGMILLDWKLPDMDGLEFLDRVRKDPRWCDLPVLMVTAMALGESETQALEGRVDRVLKKGHYTLNDLLTAVSNLMYSPAAR
jgi:signal transduction histidine kinase/DNA-binding response OmpR family regulator